MKNKLIFFLVIISLISCEKDNIEAGLQTNVSGKIVNYDNSPVTNAKVKIGEFKSHFVADGGNQDYFVKYIDSTYSNLNGEYQITFSTTGNGTSYKVILENSPDDQSYFGFYDPIEINNIGGNFVLNNFQVVKLYPCQVTINLSNVLIYPIGIRHDTTRNVYTPEINSNTTFIKTIYITDFGTQTLNFYRTKPNGVNQKAIFTFPPSNSTNLTTQNITLNETNFVDI